jgi:hypothetical protein
VIVSNVTTDQFGISDAAIDWALNLNPSSISKIILCERNDPALKDGVNDALNYFSRSLL